MLTAMAGMVAAAVVIVVTGCMSGGTSHATRQAPTGAGSLSQDASAHTRSEGSRVFRFETFGDEEFWTDKERLHDPTAAVRGRAVFVSSCIACHTDIDGTDNDAGVLHAAAATGMDDAHARRTTTKAYRTTPLRGLWQHAPYFHDGSAATLEAVVDHYDGVRKLGLTAAQRADLVQFLKSL